MTVFFDEAFYLRKYTDVAQAIAAGRETSAYNHFIKHGVKESRDPNVFFDVSYYLTNNTDVASAITAGKFANAYEHFVAYGDRELRAPSAFFDPSYYLLKNNDVAVQVYRGATTAFSHFYTYGRKEDARIATAFFDPVAYGNSNTDIKTAHAAKTTTLHDHFANYGIAERRELGNGLSLTFFNQDNTFNGKIFTGDFGGAFDRVTAVAPFVTTYIKPTDYNLSSSLKVPSDFIAPSGFGLALPPGSTLTAPSTGSFSSLTISYAASSSSLTIAGKGSKDGVVMDMTLSSAQIKDGSVGLSINTSTNWLTISAATMTTATFTFTGDSDAESVTGSEQVNVLKGGGGNDTLIGGKGADTLTGGAGTNTLTGKDGIDTFVLDQTSSGNVSTITDFVTASDKIGLSDAAYSLTGAVGDTLAAGDYLEAASAAALTGGSVTAATDAQKIIVLTDSGSIYFNTDGATAGGLVLIGVLQKAGGAVDPAVTDFVLV